MGGGERGHDGDTGTNGNRLIFKEYPRTSGMGPDPNKNTWLLPRGWLGRASLTPQKVQSWLLAGGLTVFLIPDPWGGTD